MEVFVLGIIIDNSKNSDELLDISMSQQIIYCFHLLLPKDSKKPTKKPPPLYTGGGGSMNS